MSCVALYGGPSTWPVGNQPRPVGFRVCGGCKARGPGRAGQGLAYGETTALARRFEVKDWKCAPLFMGALYFRAGGGLCRAGTRGPVALLPPRSPRLASFSLYLCSWKRALHCCDAVPCMLPVVRSTTKPRVPGGLRRRKSLNVPRSPSRPMSCPSAPPTHRGQLQGRVRESRCEVWALWLCEWAVCYGACMTRSACRCV